MKPPRPDSEIEQVLEEWLETTADPMPDTLRDAIDETPSRHAQLGRRSWRDLLRSPTRLAAFAAVAGLAIIAVYVGSGVLGNLRNAVGGPISPEPSSAAEFVWDGMLNFVGSNPAPDGYGHTAVWRYLSGPAGIHDPTQYRPLTNHGGEGDGTWSDPTIAGLAIGVPPSSESRLQIQPADGTAAVIAWRNPIAETALTIIGSVEVDGSCGDGITLLIDHAGDPFRTITLARGREDFTIPVERFAGGGVLHFIIEPGANSRCDTTWLELTIHAPATRDVGE
ncbi:MAG TPA: hypothetical protein VF365_03760 [Candidatus Limnocylindria bacterium]